MKLNRTQELALINIGFNHLLSNVKMKPIKMKAEAKPVEIKDKRKVAWSEARRKKMSAVMRKRWQIKRSKHA